MRKGGKERRLIELLKAIEEERIDYRIVVIHPEIEYEISPGIKSKIVWIKKKKKKDLSPFFGFYKICKNFNPDIIHTWSSMVTFYSIPAKVLLRKRLINSQITDAPPKFKKWSIFGLTCRTNFCFSDLIISNSKAGLKAYDAISKKSKVIYNGVELTRFVIKETKEEIKSELGISTVYSVAMVASFSDNKDYKTYIQVANAFQKIREDITFLAIGAGEKLHSCKKYAEELNLNNLKFLGQRNDIEKILKACDIGILISKVELHGEGISNSIIEYMAMSLPVIANDAGGTKEIVDNGINGFLVLTNIIEKITEKISFLLDNQTFRFQMANTARKTIEDKFNINRMLAEFLKEFVIIKK